MPLPRFGSFTTCLKQFLDNGKENQTTLAATLGKAQSTINLWVSGKRTPELDDIPRIALALGVDPAWLTRAHMSEQFPDAYRVLMRKSSVEVTPEDPLTVRLRRLSARRRRLVESLVDELAEIVEESEFPERAQGVATSITQYNEADSAIGDAHVKIEPKGLGTPALVPKARN